MSHYNLYDNFGLDSSLDSTSLAAQIDARLASTSDPLTRTQLETARDVLGDPTRRKLYDDAIADPSAPTVGPERIREIASTPTSDLIQPSPSTVSYDWGAPASSEQPAPSAPQSQVSDAAQSPAQAQSPTHASSFAQAQSPTHSSSFAQAQSPSQAQPQAAQSQAAMPPQQLMPGSGYGALPPEQTLGGKKMDIQFAIPEDRQRSSSLMWAIGWGIIFLPWLFVFFSLLQLLLSGGGGGTSLSIEDIAELENLSDEEIFEQLGGALGVVDTLTKMFGLVTTGIGAMLHTVGCLVFLQLMWTIRKIVGKQQSR